MNRIPHWLFTAAAALLLWAGPAQASNPRIHVKLDRTTLGETCAQLSRAAEIPVELYTRSFPNGVRVPGAVPEDRATFDWSDVSFSHALRELCARFNVYPSRRAGGGYTLYPGAGQAPVPPAKRVGAIEKAGVQLSVRSISLNSYRSTNFTAQPTTYGQGSVGVSINADIPDGDASTIAGIENLVAKDDLGNVLTGNPTTYYQFGDYSNGQFPDEWSSSVSLPAPHPKAKKLQWIEGDLYVYRAMKPVKAEIPLPFKGGSARTQAGDLTIVVSRYRVIPKGGNEEDDDPALPFQGVVANTGDSGPVVRVRIAGPIGARYGSAAGDPQLAPIAVGASGKKYPAAQFRGGGSTSNGQVVMTDNTWIFSGMEEAPVKLIWELQEKAKKEKLFSFRMLDIPLPEPEQFVARQNVPPAAPAIGNAVPTPNRPFYEKGGGTLIQKVELLGKPAAEGTVRVGLAAKEGTGWGPIRWVEVTVGPDGSARLEDLKPGKYKVLFRYRPKDGKLPVPGKWTNDEALVDLVKGKDTQAQPLRLSK